MPYVPVQSPRMATQEARRLAPIVGDEEAAKLLPPVYREPWILG